MIRGFELFIKKKERKKEREKDLFAYTTNMILSSRWFIEFRFFSYRQKINSYIYIRLSSIITITFAHE